MYYTFETIWKFNDLINGVISNFDIYYTRKSCLCAILCLFFCAKTAQSSFANCEWQIEQSYAIKRLFLHIIGLDFIVQNYAIFNENMSYATCAIALKKTLREI